MRIQQHRWTPRPRLFFIREGRRHARRRCGSGNLRGRHDIAHALRHAGQLVDAPRSRRQIRILQRVRHLVRHREGSGRGFRNCGIQRLHQEWHVSLRALRGAGPHRGESALGIRNQRFGRTSLVQRGRIPSWRRRVPAIRRRSQGDTLVHPFAGSGQRLLLHRVCDHRAFGLKRISCYMDLRHI